MDLKIFFLLGWLTLYLPVEPPDEYLVNERFDTVGGMYWREYSIDNNGRANYMTMRRILHVLPEVDGLLEVDERPLLLYFDYNGNGIFEADETWIDPDENGKIQQYGSDDYTIRY